MRLDRCLRCVLLALPLLAAACRPYGHLRYVDVPGTGEATRTAVREELVRRGYVVTRETPGRFPSLHAARTSPATATGAAARPSPDPRAAAPTRKPERLTVTFLPAPGGSRLEIQATAATEVAAVFPGQPAVIARPSFGLQGDRLFWELDAHVGWRHLPDLGSGLDVQVGARAGPVVATWGGGWPRPRLQAKLHLTFGLGAGALLAAGDDRWYAVPSVGLSLALRRALRPAPGRFVPTGWDYSVDLVATGLLSTERRAVEALLILRFSDFGGFYLSVGRQLEPRAGISASAGLFLGTISVIVTAAIAAYAQ